MDEARAQADRDRRNFRRRLDDLLNSKAEPWEHRVTEKEQKHKNREQARGRQSTGFDWAEVLELYGNRCAFCGVDGHMTVDHIIPISRGGGNWPWNIRPLCEPCNTLKGSQLDAEFPEGRKPF